MLLVILFIVILLLLFGSIIFYYNYIARYHRIRLYGKLTRRFPLPKQFVPVLNLDESLLKAMEMQLLQLLIHRHLPVVVCCGDSITQGMISTNYVERLQDHFKEQYHFINSGINGNLAYNLYKRLWHDCIEFRPDYITILIGTNDVNSQKNEKMNEQYVKIQQLPQKPDKAFFKKNLGKMIVKLKRQTKAKIAIFSLPLLGEDLDSPMNQMAADYSEIIRHYAVKYGLFYLPLNELQNRFLKLIENRRPTAYMKKNILKIFSLMIRRSFDKIAEINGYYLSYDGIHATTLGAIMIEELASHFIKSKGEQADYDYHQLVDTIIHRIFDAPEFSTEIRLAEAGS
ncbi:MAG: SGNH/GDSL hydrolase family protein [Spirochaetales bacterium]|nr:SGNH/GDSL hydrolase family protein [Spirochaetales bacterium]